MITSHGYLEAVIGPSFHFRPLAPRFLTRVGLDLRYHAAKQLQIARSPTLLPRPMSIGLSPGKDGVAKEGLAWHTLNNNYHRSP